MTRNTMTASVYSAISVAIDRPTDHTTVTYSDGEIKRLRLVRAIDGTAWVELQEPDTGYVSFDDFRKHYVTQSTAYLAASTYFSVWLAFHDWSIDRPDVGDDE